MFIDSHVPLPSSVNKYPFKSMAVGDSFTMPIDMRSKLQVAAYIHGKANSKKFTVRIDRSANVVRCWRIE